MRITSTGSCFNVWFPVGRLFRNPWEKTALLEESCHLGLTGWEVKPQSPLKASICFSLFFFLYFSFYIFLYLYLFLLISLSLCKCVCMCVCVYICVCMHVWGCVCRMHGSGEYTCLCLHECVHYCL